MAKAAPLRPDDLLEIAADDLVRRAKMRERESPGALGTDLVDHVEKLAKAIDERAASVEPSPDQALIEKQADRIRDLEAKMRAGQAQVVSALQKVVDLAQDRDRIEREHEHCMRLRTQEEKAARDQTAEGLAYWQEPCVRCGERRVDHPPSGSPCPVKPIKKTAAIFPCMACGGPPPIRKTIGGLLVWWCERCATIGGSEDAGIRGRVPPIPPSRPSQGGPVDPA